MKFFYMILDITAYEGKLTLHVHVGRLVHKMHEQLSSVDEDLVSAVSDRAIPPCSLRQGRKNYFLKRWRGGKKLAASGGKQSPG